MHVCVVPGIALSPCEAGSQPCTPCSHAPTTLAPPQTAKIPLEDIQGFRAPYLLFNADQREILYKNGFRQGPVSFKQPASRAQVLATLRPCRDGIGASGRGNFCPSCACNPLCHLTATS